jgi:hypothetical protein
MVICGVTIQICLLNGIQTIKYKIMKQSKNFQEFLNQYAEDNFGFDPDGNPSYFVDYFNGVISMGTILNLKFQSNIVERNKEDRKQLMIELSEDSNKCNQRKL